MSLARTQLAAVPVPKPWQVIGSVNTMGACNLDQVWLYFNCMQYMQHLCNSRLQLRLLSDCCLICQFEVV